MSTHSHHNQHHEHGPDPAPEPGPEPRPESAVIVTLCGSMRFYRHMLTVATERTTAGQIVLAPFVTIPADHQTGTDDTATEVKARLDQLHRDKIDLSDAVVVVTDATGYYGPSTAGEIAYARTLGRPVTFHAVTDPAPTTTDDQVPAARSAAESGRPVSPDQDGLPDLRPLDVAPVSIHPPYDQRRPPVWDLEASRIEFLSALRAPLAGIALGAYDLRLIAWTAGWDHPTVGGIASLLHRARAADPLPGPVATTGGSRP